MVETIWTSVKSINGSPSLGRRPSPARRSRGIAFARGARRTIILQGDDRDRRVHARARSTVSRCAAAPPRRMGAVTGDSFYDLKEPTSWANPPSTYSFTSLQALRACPRRWQLLHSTWGSFSRFPERPHPAAIEGQIVHEALDLLGRELGRRGRPAIASAGFREAVSVCGFWDFFSAQVEQWNRRLVTHPRAGPGHVVRTEPRDLANQAIRLVRMQYQPSAAESIPARVGKSSGAEGSPLSVVRTRGSVSEVRLAHPGIPVVGVVDLVALEEDLSTTVIDFKTGAPKPDHEQQVLLYALLWWRVTGNRPEKLVIQYLDSDWTMSPSESDLIRTEDLTAEQVSQATDALAARPAAAETGENCARCPVRAGCDEGWSWCERASQRHASEKAVDIEVTVSSEPTPTGFIGARANGEEVSVVFDIAVGCGLPLTESGDGFRIVDAAHCTGGTEVALLPWTEMYRQ